MEAVAERYAVMQGPRMPVQRDAPHARIVGIAQALEEEHRGADLGNRANPIEELVYIALTRQTHSKNALQSWQTISDAGGPAAILDMSEKQLQGLLEPGGLSRQKAKWIRASLSAVVRQFGELSLDAIGEWTDDAVETFLRSLPGVSTKSAKCIMMYSMSRQVLPVDVHVRRIATRLGLVQEGLSEKAIHLALERQVAPEDRRGFHVNAVWHGRKICVAQAPKCNHCVIRQFCAFGRHGRNGRAQ